MTECSFFCLKATYFFFLSVYGLLIVMYYSSKVGNKRFFFHVFCSPGCIYFI